LARIERDLTDRILVDLFDGKVAPALAARKGQKGAITEVETEVAAIIRGYDESMRDLVKEALGRELSALSLIARERLRAWLEGHGLKMAEGTSDGPGRERPLVLDSLLVGDNLVHPLVLALGGLVSVVSSTILAALFGGAGVALVAHGPAGLLAGVVGGVVLSGAGLLYGQDRIKKRLKERPMPAMVMSMIASDSMIAKIRQAFETKLAEQLRSLGGEFERGLRVALTAMIDEEIENLGLVNIF
jgi:hypothetical protein